MALLFQEIKDGIQYGKDLDKCKVCEKKAKAEGVTLQQGLLRNKEVFILNINGMRHCYCMSCFEELLGDYTLIPEACSIDFSEDKTLTGLDDAINAFDTDIEESEDTKGETSNAKDKKAKAGKSSKGK